MKQIKYLFTALLLLFIVSCKTGVYTTEGGKSDTAYLTFTSSDQYAGKTVTVILDGETTFEADVVKDKKARAKYRGRTYAITVGQKHIKVSFHDKVLFDKTIFVTTQQTKNIQLP